MDLLKEVNKQRLELDKFNLKVAEWRCKHGMGQRLIFLYREMGKLSRELYDLSLAGSKADALFESITNYFEEIRKEEMP